MIAIQDAADQAEAMSAHASKRASARGIGAIKQQESTVLAGVNPAALGPRAILVYGFAKNERSLATEMAAINQIVIQPLINASKGALLQTPGNNTAATDRAFFSQKRSSTLSIMEGRVAKMQGQFITDQLLISDVQIFLRSSESMALQLADFVGQIEGAATAASWSESILIGKVFNSLSATSICKLFQSYASGQQAAQRVLSSPAFEQFFKAAEKFVS